MALVLTFLSSYALAVLFYFSSKTLVMSLAFGIGVMWIPGAVAILFAKREGIKLQVFRGGGWSYLRAAVRASAICILALVLSLPFGTYVGMQAIDGALGFHLNLSEPLYSLTLGAILVTLSIVIGMSVNMIATLGEELMWRGYLWEKWKHLGFRAASLRIGLLWGLWHLPLVVLLGLNYPGHPWIGMVMLTVGTITMTPLLLQYRVEGKPIGVCAAFHGTVNRWGPMALILFAQPNLLVVGVAGLIGLLSFALFSMPLLLKVKAAVE